MEELSLGQATIVYEGPDGERREQTVDNEDVLYVRDHWAVRTETDESGNDRMLQIPKERVFHVNRNVETFEEEARTVRHRFQSIAKDITEMLPGDGGQPGGGRRRPRGEREEVERIEVDDGREE